MKVKEYKPRYKLIELSMSDEECSYLKIIGVVSWSNCFRKYGDYRVLSAKDYTDTHTTAMIIEEKLLIH